MPTFLIVIAITFFFLFTNPIYNDISALNSEVTSYSSALDNSKMFENERDKLTAKYNAINPDNLTKLQKLLPENVDNVRLILEIGQIALPYGMVLKDVKYDTLTNTKDATNNSTSTASATQTTNQLSAAKNLNKDYGTWDLKFSTQGNYNNFVNFVKDLESNLRIVDISSVDFSSSTGVGINPNITNDAYKYDFTIKTYWLKN